MNIIPYKSRKIDIDKKVRMYRCLNKKGFVFSLSQNKKVVGHTTNIVLKNCKLIVMESGKNRCIKEKQRNVHAFVEGYIGTEDDIKLTFSFLLEYNPFEDKKFYTIYCDDLTGCEIVYLKNNKIYCQI